MQFEANRLLREGHASSCEVEPRLGVRARSSDDETSRELSGQRQMEMASGDQPYLRMPFDRATKRLSVVDCEPELVPLGVSVHSG